jgi:AcrR family transcriptional regulator
VASDDPRARRRQATMDRILDAAWELAEEQGLAGISLRDLAARVDLRQPSLYSYFDSKHALYDAMFAQGCEQMLEGMRAGPVPSEPRKMLKEMARRFATLAVENPARAQLLFQRTIPGFEPSPASYKVAQELLDEGRARLAAAGLTKPRHLDLYTAIISGITNQQLANDPGGTRWLRLVDDSMDMYLDHTLGDGPDGPNGKNGKNGKGGT